MYVKFYKQTFKKINNSTNNSRKVLKENIFKKNEVIFLIFLFLNSLKFHLDIKEKSNYKVNIINHFIFTIG
jgi:hypothetical protein